MCAFWFSVLFEADPQESVSIIEFKPKRAGESSPPRGAFKTRQYQARKLEERIKKDIKKWISLYQKEWNAQGQVEIETQVYHQYYPGKEGNCKICGKPHEDYYGEA